MSGKPIATDQIPLYVIHFAPCMSAADQEADPILSALSSISQYELQDPCPGIQFCFPNRCVFLEHKWSIFLVSSQMALNHDTDRSTETYGAE